MSDIESFINKVQTNITNDLERLVGKLKNTLDIRKPIVTRIQELKDNIDQSFLFHSSASSEHDVNVANFETIQNNLVQVNFGGKRVSVDVDTIMNPLVPHNFFSLLFHPRWRNLLPKDKDGNIYFEWEYQWIQPILEAYEMLEYCHKDHDDDETSVKHLSTVITWKGRVHSPLPILFNEIFAIPSELNTDNHCMQISCNGLPSGQLGCTEIETFKRLLLIMHPHQLRNLLKEFIMNDFDTHGFKVEIGTDWLTYGAKHGHLENYKFDCYNRRVLLLYDPIQQQFFCFLLCSTKESCLISCSTHSMKFTKDNLSKTTIRWQKRNDRYVFQLLKSGTHQIIFEIDTKTNCCILPDMTNVNDDSRSFEIAQVQIVENCIIIPLQLSRCELRYGDEKEHVPVNAIAKQENINMIPCYANPWLHPVAQPQGKECDKPSTSSIQEQISSLEVVLEQLSTSLHQYLYVQYMEAKFLKAIFIDRHFQSINAFEYCVGSFKHEIQTIANEHAGRTTNSREDDIVTEVLLDRIHTIYEQLVLQTSLGAQQLKTCDIIYFNVGGETVCLLKSSILFAIPDSQLAIRVSGQWTETENTMDSEGRLIIPFPRILFLPLVEMIRKASVFRIKPLAVFYPSLKLVAIGKEMLQYFAIDSLTVVMHHDA